jgi:hypothetical protein
MVEGTIGRLFGGGLRPVEIGHRIARAMVDSRSVGVRGQPVVANHFSVALAPDDLERFADVHDSLVRELCDAARDHAREENWSFMGPVQVELVADPGRRAGSVEVAARMKEADGAAGLLVLPTGEQIVLTEYLVTFGRLPECTVSFDNTNVSRRHAEIRPEGDGFVLIDLGSTNGTMVNGARISRHRLLDGDHITFGSTEVVFRAG